MIGPLLNIADVVARVRLSKPTIYKLVRAGTFPRQVRMSENRVMWRGEEIDAWIEERARSRFPEGIENRWSPTESGSPLR